MSSLPTDPPAFNGVALGEALRDEALARLRRKSPALNRQLQAAALQIAFDRGQVCADDVRAVVPIPPGVHASVNGAAFNTLGKLGFIRPVAFLRSCRAKAHRRPIRQWELADAVGAAAFLSALRASQTTE